jgi:predicted CxxxxCH...CXXCH cytochrome family protein
VTSMSGKLTGSAVRCHSGASTPVAAGTTRRPRPVWQIPSPRQCPVYPHASGFRSA